MATVKTGMVESLNSVRQIASNEYQKIIAEIDENSGIDVIAQPLLAYPNLMNEFINALVQKISYSQLESKLFNNPLKFLEGDNIPLGAIGEEIYINPAKGRKYDINDFAGLLKRYETDVKVQYQTINLDEQYPVQVFRQKLKQALTSWQALEEFITNITTSAYNGAYIDQYNYTKNLVTNAYRQNAVQIKKLDGVSTKELAENFVEQARTMFLNFQSPSTKYNAWKKVGGYGRDIITWSNPDDIVFLIRNDIQAKLDVQVLAKAFNVDSTKLLGRITPVDNFDIVDKDYNVIFDGSKILGIMCDKSWFRIKEQDMYMDDFRNANNRSITYYLNVIKMYQYSYFANAVVFATEEPQVEVTGIETQEKEITLDKVGDSKEVTISVVPPTANTPKITYSAKTGDKFDVKENPNTDRKCTITAKASGSDTLEIKAGNIKKEITVTVNS